MGWKEVKSEKGLKGVKDPEADRIRALRDQREIQQLRALRDKIYPQQGATNNG